MSEQPAATPGATGRAPIEAGTVLGGRFMIERAHAQDALGQTFLARDQKTKKPIAIRLLSEGFVGDRQAFESLKAEIRTAAKLKHRALVGTFGVGTHGGGSHFVACEWIQGANLAEFVQQHNTEGKHVSLRGVFNVVAHVCKALTTIHTETYHGAVRPAVVWVTRSGRVKLGDFGMGRAMVSTGRWQDLDATDQAFLAPEVKAGGEPTSASDVFGVGALLYCMLTGRSPTDDFVPPSQAHPDASVAVDDILMRCLAPEPSQRFATVSEISEALMPLVAGAPEATANEFGVDLEIDVDVAASMAPPAPAEPTVLGTPSIPVLLSNSEPPAPPAVQFLNAGGEAPPPPMSIGRPSPADPLAAAPLPPPAPAAGPPAAPEPATPSMVPEVDFQDLMTRLTMDDRPRWMAVKDGMDHGPFSARELVKLIVDGEITEDNELLNMSSNERKPLAEYDEFKEFVEQYKIRKAEKDFAVALERSDKVEKRSSVAKFVFLSVAVVAVLGGGYGYYQSRKAAEAKAAVAEVDLASLYESGQVKITGTAGILKFKRRAGGGGSRPGGARSPGGGGGLSYEDAMNQAMELGDATKGGGERQLTSSDVAGVMNRKLNSLFGCVSQELRKGGKLGTVRIDLAILGSGRVMGASINTGSPAFKQCINKKVQKIPFPPFPAPRMGARYSFDVD